MSLCTEFLPVIDMGMLGGPCFDTRSNRATGSLSNQTFDGWATWKPAQEQHGRSKERVEGMSVLTCRCFPAQGFLLDYQLQTAMVFFGLHDLKGVGPWRRLLGFSFVSRECAGNMRHGNCIRHCSFIFLTSWGAVFVWGMCR
jgi:hypothetical protein